MTVTLLRSSFKLHHWCPNLPFFYQPKMWWCLLSPWCSIDTKTSLSTTRFLPSMATISGCHMLMMLFVDWLWGLQFTGNSNAPWTGMSYPIILAPCHHPRVELQKCTVGMRLTESLPGHQTHTVSGHNHKQTLSTLNNQAAIYISLMCNSLDCEIK